MHKLLSFYPFSWCYAHPSPAPLLAKVSGFTLMLAVVGCCREQSASGDLHQEE